MMRAFRAGSQRGSAAGVRRLRPGVIGLCRRRPTVVARAKDDKRNLDTVHEELLKEIQERRRSQEALLARLAQLTSETAALSEPIPLDDVVEEVTKPTPVAARRAVAPAPPPPPPVRQAPPSPLPTAAPGGQRIAGRPPQPPSVAAPTPPPLSVRPAVTRATPPAYLEPEQPVTQPVVYKAAPAAPLAPEPAEPLAGPNVMKIVMVGAECAPWSKTGGLGDVMGALPKALAHRGHRVMVVVPRYDNYEGVVDTGVRRKFNMRGQDVEVGYFHQYLDGVDYVFVDHAMFRRGNDLYGGDRLELSMRCALLSKAALESVWHVPCGGVAYGDDNCVFIANDWHTAMLPVYLQAHYRDYNQMTYSRAVFVIHNMAHQGRGPFDEIANFELNDEYKEKFRLYDDMFGCEHMNILKVGLECAHRIIAVSRGYAWECQTPEGGWGLNQTLEKENWKLRGIVNGIDYKEWSPESDVFLQTDGYTNYDLQTLHAGKAACKVALQKEFGLPVNPDIPLLGFIGRLDYQKGIDLIRDNYEWIMQEGCQMVFLGSGTAELEESLREMESKNPHKCKSWVGFSVKMAHRITAGIDLLLMPSRFEPCGLNQLYAMAYGTVPVVHAVGGLRDTVLPFNPHDSTGTGWTFERAEKDKLRESLGYALSTYRDHRKSFRELQARGMAQDLSWDHAAALYEEVLVEAKFQW